MSGKQISKLTNRGASREQWARRRGTARAIGVSTFMIAGLVALVSPSSPAAADGGDYKLDFVASAPGTYDHDIGGGAFDDRSVGVNKDIVESLEGGDFECLDIVTYLTQIRREPDPDNTEPEDLRLHFSFLADTTGKSGIAMIPPQDPPLSSGTNFPRINYEPVPIGVGEGVGLSDAGIIDPDSDSLVEDVVWGTNDKLPFTKAAETTLALTVTDIEPGVWVVLRVDLQLACDSPRPTGNLQAQLNFTDVVNSTTTVTPDRVPGGEQTIPFKQVGAIYPVACPEQDDYPDKPESCNFTSAVASVNLITEESVTEPSGKDGGKSKRTPVVGTVTELLSTNPEASSMFVAGGLIGLVAMRRRSTPRRRSAS